MIVYSWLQTCNAPRVRESVSCEMRRELDERVERRASFGGKHLSVLTQLSGTKQKTVTVGGMYQSSRLSHRLTVEWQTKTKEVRWYHLKDLSVLCLNYFPTARSACTDVKASLVSLRVLGRAGVEE